MNTQQASGSPERRPAAPPPEHIMGYEAFILGAVQSILLWVVLYAIMVLKLRDFMEAYHMSPSLIIVLTGGIVVGYFKWGIRDIEIGHQAVVILFGVKNKVLLPVRSWLPPWYRIELVNMQVRTITIDLLEVLTKSGVRIDPDNSETQEGLVALKGKIGFVYQIGNAVQYFRLNPKEVDDGIKNAVVSELRNSAIDMLHFDFLKKRPIIENEILNAVREEIDNSYGPGTIKSININLPDAEYKDERFKQQLQNAAVEQLEAKAEQIERQSHMRAVDELNEWRKKNYPGKDLDDVNIREAFRYHGIITGKRRAEDLSIRESGRNKNKGNRSSAAEESRRGAIQHRNK
jgi:hypothetical protein